MFYTYILKSKVKDKCYTGSTKDLRERLKQHNDGKSNYTKKYRPYEIIYYEACTNEQDARSREKYLKTGMGKRYIKNRLRHSLALTGLILTILVGIFSPMLQARAQASGTPMCYTSNGTPISLSVIGASSQCNAPNVWTSTPPTSGSAAANIATGNATITSTTIGTCSVNVDGSTQATLSECTQAGGSLQSINPTTPAPTGNSDFVNAVTNDACLSFFNGSVSGCAVQFFYYVFYIPSAFLLTVAAKFFNALISIALNSTLFAKSTFIPTAWAVVRDISNIFFILVLLYIAVKLILGLGGHDTKKTIVMVILLALLINFSMFFTDVVIDTSNVLALVFYNKLNTCINKDPTTGACTPDTPSTAGEINISSSMYGAFDPTTKLTNANFFNAAKIQTVQTSTGPVSTTVSNVPAGTVIGIILISVAIMVFAAYAFFISGIAFLSRMIELWILIIFSPFAFMSSSIPLLGGIEYLGWGAWSKRLLKVAFMAPIFMFFMYLIFLLLGANLFSNLITTQGMIQTILLVIIQAFVNLILLIKATEFAKKGSGALGEALIKSTEIAMGVVGGLALGGTAIAGRTVVGGGGGYLLNKLAGSQEKPNSLSNRLGFSGVSRGLRDISDKARKSSFDAREGAVGAVVGAVGGISGLNLSHSSTSKLFKNNGGWDAMKKQQVEKRQKRSDELEKRGTGGQRKRVEEAEIALREARRPIQLELDHLDVDIDKASRELTDARNGGEAPEIIKTLKNALQAKKDTKTNLLTNAKIPELEAEVRKNKQILTDATAKVATDYANMISSNFNKNINSIFRFGAYSRAGADEAARKIKLGIKAENSGGGGQKSQGSHAPTSNPKPASTPPPSGGGSTPPPAAH